MGKEREILEVWDALKVGVSNLAEESPYLSVAARRLLELMNEFELGGNYSLHYCPFNLVDDEGRRDAGLTLRLKEGGTYVVLTPEALRGSSELLRVLIRELTRIAWGEAEDYENIASYFNAILAHQVQLPSWSEGGGAWSMQHSLRGSDRPFLIFLTKDTLDEYFKQYFGVRDVSVKEFLSDPATLLEECRVVVPRVAGR